MISTANVAPRHRSHWYVAGTQPAKEGVAQINLERQGFATFLPKMRRLQKRGRRTEVRLTPLFPGYIFVSFDPDNAPWRSINGTLGVRRLLGSDARPQPTPPDLVPTLAGRCQNGLLEVHPFSAGDAVRILSGPFADRIAVIEGMHAADRVRVLLEIMGTFARVDLAPTDLAVE